ncbi:MAG: hypothetical protein HYU52_16475 [Acidobacteria bacterium]|nr:hypothetical protein [Acidobacteriota bacterium]
MTDVPEIEMVHDAPRSGARVGGWLAGCALLLAILVVRWAEVPAEARFRPPTSPLDNVGGLNKTTRFGWGFLWQVREILPAGSTYTIVAGDRDTEMSLFMLSFAVLTDCKGLPTSYYGIATPERGAEARYVLSYGCVAAIPGATSVEKLGDGCIWDRGER